MQKANDAAFAALVEKLQLRAAEIYAEAAAAAAAAAGPPLHHADAAAQLVEEFKGDFDALAPRTPGPGEAYDDVTLVDDEEFARAETRRARAALLLATIAVEIVGVHAGLRHIARKLGDAKARATRADIETRVLEDAEYLRDVARRDGLNEWETLLFASTGADLVRALLLRRVLVDAIGVAPALDEEAGSDTRLPVAATAALAFLENPARDEGAYDPTSATGEFALWDTFVKMRMGWFAARHGAAAPVAEEDIPTNEQADPGGQRLLGIASRLARLAILAREPTALAGASLQRTQRAYVEIARGLSAWPRPAEDPDALLRLFRVLADVGAQAGLVLSARRRVGGDWAARPQENMVRYGRQHADDVAVAYDRVWQWALSINGEPWAAERAALFPEGDSQARDRGELLLRWAASYDGTTPAPTVLQLARQLLAPREAKHTTAPVRLRMLAPSSGKQRYLRKERP